MRSRSCSVRFDSKETGLSIIFSEFTIIRLDLFLVEGLSCNKDEDDRLYLTPLLSDYYYGTFYINLSES